MNSNSTTHCDHFIQNKIEIYDITHVGGSIKNLAQSTTQTNFIFFGIRYSRGFRK